MMAKLKVKVTSERPFKTDYGTTSGHCATKKRAFQRALWNIIEHELKHVTIEGPSGQALCRIRRPGTGFWGILIEPVGGRPQVVPGTEPDHLRRVK